ncbi:hypothetical protein B0H14DRAFT_2618412 [Mycena olivaceomarginata]|nr:hypothetical protein B0H14DRAFT_2618412 [Mycena olivaceomarginata]
MTLDAMNTDAMKRERHAEAQRRYPREVVPCFAFLVGRLTLAFRNLEATREKPGNECDGTEPVEARRIWRQRRGNGVDRTPTTTNTARRPFSSKFVKQFGHSQFMDVYFLLYEERGERHLPGLKFASAEGAAARERKRNIRAHRRK